MTTSTAMTETTLLDGAAGNDALTGGLGSDTISGGSEIDSVDYSARTSSITVSLNNQPGDGEVGELDNVRSDVENLMGGRGDDHLIGNSQVNVIEGYYGNDQIDGGLGADRISDFDGDEDIVDYSARTGAVTWNYLLATPDGESGEGDQISGIEGAIGGAGDDQLTGQGFGALTGGSGNDTLVNGTTVNGDDGNDTLRAALVENGGNGNDSLTRSEVQNGGAGNDHLDGGPDDILGLRNVLNGGDGNDTIDSYGDGLRDTVRGGNGFDIAHVSDIDDVAECEQVQVM